MKKLFYCAIFMFMMGCATIPPIIQDVESQRSIYANYNKVWVEINNFFRDRNIPIKSANSSLGMIETDGIKIPYEGFEYTSDYCDCGTLGGIHVYREIRGQYEVYIQRIKENETYVRFEAKYRASLWSANNFRGWVLCQSKGSMESRFFNQMNASFKPPEKKSQQEEL